MELFKTADEASREVRSTGQTGTLPSDRARMEPPRQAIATPQQTEVTPPVQEEYVHPAVESYRRGLSTAPETEPAEEYVHPAVASYRASRPKREQSATTSPREEPGLLSDSANLLGMGVDSLALNVRELVGRIPGVGEYIVSGLDAVDKAFTGKDSETLLKDNLTEGRADLSTATREASDKDWWDSEKGRLGPAWTDPRSYMSGILMSLPEQTITMFPAMRLAKSVYSARVAAGMSAQEASKAAARAATIAGGVSEGLLAGAASSRDVRDRVMEIPLEQLEESDAFRALVLNGMTPEAARSSLANDVATQAFLTAGAVTGAFGGFGDRLLAKAITEGVGKGVVGRFARGAVAEGALEEFPQSYSATVAENVAMQRADPSIGATDGALNDALGGLATGSIQGGAMTAVLGRSTASPEPQPSAPVVPDDQADATRGQFAMTDDEYRSVAQSPAIMAAIYETSDDPTKALLEQVAPDLPALVRDEELLTQGREFVGSNPSVVASFLGRLQSDNAPSTTAVPDDDGIDERDVLPFDNGQDETPSDTDFVPTRANLQRAKLLSEQVIGEQEQGLSREKPKKPDDVEPGELVPGPEVTPEVTPEGPTPGQLLQGFERAVRNIQEMPPAAQRAAAISSMADMQRYGFTAEQANRMFGQFLGGQNNAQADTTNTNQEATPSADVDGKLNAIYNATNRPEFENGWFDLAGSLPSGSTIYDADTDETYTVSRSTGRSGTTATTFTGTTTSNGGNIFFVETKADGSTRIVGDLPVSKNLKVQLPQDTTESISPDAAFNQVATTDNKPETVSERLQTFNKVRKLLVKQDKDAWQVDSTENDYAPANLSPAIYKLAEAFGVKIVGFRYTGKDTKIGRRSGISTPDGIALNVAAKDQWLTVLGHEVYHNLAKRDKAAAKDLEARVLSYLNAEGNQGLRTRLLNLGYKPEKINEESVADIMGVMFQDNQFWERLGMEQPNLLQKVLRVIDDLISRFGGLTNRQEEFAAQIRELETVRDMMADFVSQALDKQANAINETDDAIEIGPDPVAQFRELAIAGNKAAAAKVFNTAKLREQLGNFNQAYEDAINPEQATPVDTAENDGSETQTEANQDAPDSSSTVSPAVKQELDRMYRERAAGTAEMNAFDQQRALDRYAKDLSEYGFSDAEISDILQGESDVIDPATLKTKKVKFGYSKPAQTKEPTTRVSSENPNVFEGTRQPQFIEPTDVGTAPSNPQVRREQAKAKAKAESRTYSDGVARALIKQEIDPKGDSDILVQLEYEFTVPEQVQDPESGSISTVQRPVAKIFSARDKYFRFNIKPDGSYYPGKPTEDVNSLIAKPPAGSTLRRVSGSAPSQPSLDLYGNRSLANKFQAEVQRIMTTAFTPSQVTETLQALRNQLAQSRDNPSSRRGKKLSDVEYLFEMPGDNTAPGSAPMVFDPMSGERMEGKAERRSVEAVLSEKIEAAQRGDVKARAGLLKVHASKIEESLSELLQEMADAGLNEQQINDIVSPAQESMRAIQESEDIASLAGNLQQLADRVANLNGLSPEQREAETVEILRLKREIESQQPADDLVSQRDFDTLPLPTRDLSDARMSAAAAVDEIVSEGVSPLAVLRRELNKPDRQFTFSDLRKELASRGLDVSQIDREVAQWPAAQYSLEYWVRKNTPAMSPYAARTAWFNSHEQIMSVYRDDPQMRQQYENELSEVERRIIDNMRTERAAVRTRRDEQVDITGRSLTTAKEAFPHALFNKYRLDDMRNLDESNIPEEDANILRSLVGGNTQFLPRLWLDDVAYAMDARKDLRDEIMGDMTERERNAVTKYLKMTASILANNQRISALNSYSTMLDGIGGLDRAAYDAFKSQIIYADLKAIPGILQRAQEIADLTANVKDKKELPDILSAYLDRIYSQDERSSQTLDETQQQFAEISGRGVPSVTDEDVQEYTSSLARMGSPYMDPDTARAALYYQKAAESVALEQQDIIQANENEVASPSSDIPENQAGLSGDIQYKRGRYSSGPAAAAVTAHIAELTSGWKNKPNVQVFYNVDQITDPELRERLTARVEAGGFKGAIDPDTGAVYIFSQHLEDMDDAEFVLFHELYGHWGLRRFLGDKLNAFLENQYRLNKKVRAEADRQFDEALKDGSPMSRVESIEEAISDMAVKGEPSLFRQLIGQLVSWMRKHDMNKVADWMDSTGASELAFVLSQARRVARRGTGISPLNGAPQAVLYSRNKAPVETFAVRDGKVTGYARINPVNQYWTVFTIKDLQTGEFGAVTVETFADVTEILKKVGTVASSRDRETRVDFDPNNLETIPDKNDLTGWKKFVRNMQIQAQNMYLPVFEVARWLDSKGIKNTVVDDILKYESRLGNYIKDYEKRFVNPIQRLLDAAAKKGATIEDIDEFLVARTASERNAAIRAINPTNNAGSGMSDDKARQILKNAPSTPFYQEMEEIGKLTDQMSKDKLAYMFETGLINKFQYASSSRYDHYVNLSGNKKTDLDAYDATVLGGKSFNLRGTDLIRATGRGTEAVDVLQNTMNAYMATLIRGQKNRVIQAILSMFERNPDASYMRIDPIVERKQINVEKLGFDKKVLNAIGDAPNEASGRQYLRSLSERMRDGEIDTDDAMSELTARIVEAERRRDGLDPAEATRAIRMISERVVSEGRLSPDGYVTMVEDNSLMKDDAVQVARVNGRPIIMRFQERAGEFIQSLSGMNVQQSGVFVEAIGKWNRFFSLMVTTWNPAWLPINFIRDIQTAFSNAASDPDVGLELANKMRKEWMPALRAAYKWTVKDQAEMKGKLKQVQQDPKWQKLIDEFFADGSGTFFLDRKGVEMSIERINRTMNGPKGALQHVEDKLEVIGDFMDLLATPSELAPRLAAYKVLREAGWSRERASAYAKELTVNFNAKGAYKPLRALYVFANPAIQGTYRMFQDYSRGDSGVKRLLPSNRFAAVAAGWMMAGMLANYIARAIGGEDEERPGVDKLDMLPNFRRATSLVFMPDMIGGSMPIAYGWNVFATAGTYMFDTMTGKLKPEVAATRTMAAAFDSFAPIGSGAESKSVTGALLKTFLPSPFVPLAEMAMNENRFGAPIHKEQNPFSTVSEANAYMHFDSVNPLSRSVMRALSEIGARGNPRYSPGLLDVNPAWVDHLISSYLPGLFTEAYKGVGWAINKMQGVEVRSGNVPVLDRFNAKIPEGFDAGAIRRVSEKVSTLHKEFNEIDTRPERRKEIAKKHPGLFTAYAVINGETQRLKGLSETLKSVEKDPRISEKAKIDYRNSVKQQQKDANRRMVQVAIQAGFRDEVIDNRSAGVVGAVADRLRGE